MTIRSSTKGKWFVDPKYVIKVNKSSKIAGCLVKTDLGVFILGIVSSICIYY